MSETPHNPNDKQYSTPQEVADTFQSNNGGFEDETVPQKESVAQGRAAALLRGAAGKLALWFLHKKQRTAPAESQEEVILTVPSEVTSTPYEDESNIKQQQQKNESSSSRSPQKESEGNNEQPTIMHTIAVPHVGTGSTETGRPAPSIQNIDKVHISQNLSQIMLKDLDPETADRVISMAQEKIIEARAEALASQVMAVSRKVETNMSAREKKHREHLQRKPSINPREPDHIELERKSRITYTLKTIRDYAKRVAIELEKAGIRPNTQEPTEEQLNTENAYRKAQGLMPIDKTTLELQMGFNEPSDNLLKIVNIDRTDRGLKGLEDKTALARLMGFRYNIEEPYIKESYGVPTLGWKDTGEKISVFVVQAFGKRNPQFTSNPNANPPYFFDGGWGIDSQGNLVGCYYNRVRMLTEPDNKEMVGDTGIKVASPEPFKMFVGASRHETPGDDESGEGYLKIIVDSQAALDDLYRSLTGKVLR